MQRGSLFASRRRRLAYLSLVAVGVLLLAYRLRAVLNPLLLALLIAYVLDPLVRVFEHRLRLPRSIAILTLLLLVGAGCGGLVIYSLGGSTRGLDALLTRAAGGWTFEPPAAAAGEQPPAAVAIGAPQALAAGAAASAPPVAASLRGRIFGRGYVVEQPAGLAFLDLDQDGQRSPIASEPGAPLEPLLVRTESGELVLEEAARRAGWRHVRGYLDEIGEALLVRYRSLDPELVDGAIGRLKKNTTWLADVAQAVWSWISGELFSGLITVVGYIFLVPIYTFFLLLGFPRLRGQLRAYLPGRHRERILHVLGRIDLACAAFFRGRLLLATAKGVFCWLGLWALGVEFSLTIGFIVGALSFIPVVGVVIGFLLAVIFSYGPVGWGARILGALAVFVAAEVLEAAAGPLVLGREVGLHPVVVLVALFAFGELFGLFGVLLAIPLAAIAKILIEELLLPELRLLAAERPAAAGGSAPEGAA